MIFRFFCYQLGCSSDIGSVASVVDISRDNTRVAKQVHISARSVDEDRLGNVQGSI